MPRPAVTAAAFASSGTHQQPALHRFSSTLTKYSPPTAYNFLLIHRFLRCKPHQCVTAARDSFSASLRCPPAGVLQVGRLHIPPTRLHHLTPSNQPTSCLHSVRCYFC
ncbi:hypothetical protein PMIN01_01840 [Paraphaeosphaeria minitans]|uniref:Uncharacterized protein n=1 Tax=Paraphaeosphaeria minitans TaxID=565426 RepID=A0A9P6GP18_9PLEO|nr:hypothetical protein PMIN01_01840 [Paraphaeosphaeria minitans]